ncbi:biosynthetic-type acetolactate synthase large subunit [Granulicella tundricola]|uniref:Acetolactate synthase n=1 Tax=Granulicella tundricola (strain ATCC BAA-1859 / DSM 23138 / MP5ACTX9) TaxID=1198114 RepID=E8WXU2_GRATM|nr:biosynthetic-type acetolactate synthase large subunit [Granulicella tundricola]ADW69787.1 acetolactate synthase, large subunit, biosynthetic type [Granulicella tundricola MP5ACTX9]
MTNNQHPQLTGSEILWATLAGEGTTTVFGYPGGAILPIYDALRKFPTIHHVLVRHEQGASHMADGYARASGRVGVCMATSGPGATNLVTGIATAMLDSIPMVAITGQVSSKVLGSDAFQEVDITGITLPITKHNFLVTRAEDIAPTVRLAFQIAQQGRPGPVLVDITKDAQQASAPFDFDSAAPPIHRPHPMLRATSNAIREAIALITSAKRPVILGGHGITQSGAEAEVITFAERLQIPIASTLLGLGSIPAGHPLSLGMMGMHGESWVNQAIQESDLLLAFGMRFDDRVTGNLASYAPNAKKIHIEIDPSEISKNVKADVALIGDLKEVLNTLLPLLEGRHSERSSEPPYLSSSEAPKNPWLQHINTSKGTAAVRDILSLPDNGHLYAAHVINDIWREAVAAGREKDTIIVTDVGQHQMWEAQYFKHEAPRSLVTSGGLGTMGFALPAAIGAKSACPDKDVWVIAGDGGFQMTASELSTIMQEGLAINIAVINNGFLGMVRQWQETFYDKNYSASPILSPDFVMLAAAHGISGAHVFQRKDVTPTVTKARTSGKPFLINFQVEKEDGVYPMIAPGAALHEMVRRPLHDPLLETAEDE